MDIKGLEAILASTHYMLAAALRIEELKLSQPEAQTLAVAMANVARHYPAISATQLVVDWVALITVCGVTYGTRYAAYEQRKKREKMPKVNPISNVISPTFAAGLTEQPN